MNGRVPRTKSPGQFVAELESLRVRGWEDMVFVLEHHRPQGPRLRLSAML